MSSADDMNRVWPACQNTSSATISFFPRIRNTRGVGSFYAGGFGLTDLSIVFPTGRDVQTTHAAIKEACIRHIMNNPAFTAWWSPPTGTLESNLRTALDAVTIPNSTSAVSVTVLLSFDGQFSSVTVG